MSGRPKPRCRTSAGKSRIAYRARAPGRRSPHSSPGSGEPVTWRRGTGDRTAAAVEVREMRDAETTLAVLEDRSDRRLARVPPRLERHGRSSIDPQVAKPDPPNVR